MARHLPLVRQLTSSSIKCFRKCKKKYDYTYEQWYEPVHRAHALEFGTHVHAGVEAYWRARKAGAADPYRAAISALPEMTEFDRVDAEVMLLCYAFAWNPVPFEVLGVEVGFDLPLINPQTGEEHKLFRRAGKIDLIGRYENGDIALVEHKTSSDSLDAGGAYFRRLTLDEQISMYYDACCSMGLRPDVIVYDVLKKPDIDPKKASETPRLKKDGTPAKNSRLLDETPVEYMERLVERMTGNINKYIRRENIYRFDDEMEKFRMEIWNEAENMAFATLRGTWTKTSEACIQRYGVCDFMPVCEGASRITDVAYYRKKEAAHSELNHTPTEAKENP